MSQPLFSAPPPSIERLSADERSLLEDTLARRFVRGSHNPDPDRASEEARQAVRAWVQVQSARLLRPSGNTQDASLRPEYADALNNFLGILHPSVPLQPDLRQHLVIAFNRQRTEGRNSPPAAALVDTEGIEALAAQGYRLDGRTGVFQPQPQPPHPAVGPWLDHVQGLSSAPRSGTGKLPDSEQYQYIKSMTPDHRTFLETSLEARLLDPAGQPSPEAVQEALAAWLTTQQVRLQVHSEASTHRRAQASQSPLDRLRRAVDMLNASQDSSVLSQSRGGHELPGQHEQAIALNNFLRLLHPSSPLSADLKQRVTERLSHHAETDGTFPARVVEAMRQHGPHALAAANWQLNPMSHVFSASPATVLLPSGRKSSYMAIPAPLAPASPSQPLSRNTPASAPAPT